MDASVVTKEPSARYEGGITNVNPSARTMTPTATATAARQRDSVPASSAGKLSGPESIPTYSLLAT